MLLQVESAVADHSNAYVIRITNDLYQPPQPVETVVTSRMAQRTAGAAEAAAASAAAAAAAAAAVGPSAKVGVLNKVSANSATGLVGLNQVLVCFNICCNAMILQHVYRLT